MRTALTSSLLLLLALPHAARAELPAIKDNQLVLKDAVAFETGSDRIAAQSDGPLDQVREFLVEKTYVSTLRIEVHSDSTGAAAFNQQLSEKRAIAVARWLVAHNIDCKRLIAVGFGDTKPIADNKTPEGRAQNRRTVFAIAGLRGRAIGGMPLDGGGKLAGDACTK